DPPQRLQPAPHAPCEEDGADGQQPAQQLPASGAAGQGRGALDQPAGDALQGGFEGTAGPGMHGGLLCVPLGTPSIVRIAAAAARRDRQPSRVTTVIPPAARSVAPLAGLNRPGSKEYNFGPD